MQNHKKQFLKSEFTSVLEIILKGKEENLGFLYAV